MTDVANCLWCRDSFTPRASGGKPQRFCSADCRTVFHKAARVWAEREVIEGRADVAALRDTLAGNVPQQHIRCSGADLALAPAPDTPKSKSRPRQRIRCSGAIRLTA
jgi:hypothetical protein